MLSNQPKTTKIRSLQSLDKTVEAKSCPKCGSFFITNNECEACGLQLDKDLLGEAFGHRSFFGLKEEYVFNHKWTFVAMRLGFMRENTIIKRYRGALIRRFELLVTYFKSEEGTSEKRKLFLFEAKELMGEFYLCGGKLSDLWQKLEPIEGSLFFQDLSRCLVKMNEEESTFSVTQNTLTSLREAFAHPIGFGFIFRFVVGSSVIIGTSYLVFKLLITSSLSS